MSLVGLIPAAGRGKRLAPLPMPKELFPIGYQDITIDGVRHKRPKVISQYLVESLRDAGVEKIIVALGPDKHDIMHYFGNGRRFGVEMCYVYQEEPSGMPFALDLAWPWLNGGDEIYFGMPDTIIEPSNTFERLGRALRDRGSDMVLGLFPTSTPSKYGMVMYQPDGDVIETIDKPSETTLIHMWGNVVWSMRFTQYLHEYLQTREHGGKELVFGSVINAAVRSGLSVTAEVFEDGKYVDIGTVEELDSALQRYRL